MSQLPPPPAPQPHQPPPGYVPPGPYQPGPPQPAGVPAPGWASQGGDPIPAPAAASGSRAPGLLIAGAGVLGIVGSVLPWVGLSGPAKPLFEAALEAQGEGLGGLDKDGALTIVLAIVVVVCGLVRAGRKAPRATAIVGLVMGALTALIAVIDIADVTSIKDDVPFLASTDITISVGIGLWLTLVAGVAMAATSLLALLRKR